MANGSLGVAEIAKRLNFGDMEVNHGGTDACGRSELPPHQLALLGSNVASDVGIRQTHLKHQNIRRVFGELSENAHLAETCRRAEEAKSLCRQTGEAYLSGSQRIENRELTREWRSLEQIYKLHKVVEEKEKDVLLLQPPIPHLEEVKRNVKQEEEAVKAHNEKNKLEREAEAESGCASFMNAVAKVHGDWKHLEEIQVLERQAPADFRSGQDIDEDMQELERLLRETEAEALEVEASLAQAASNNDFTQVISEEAQALEEEINRSQVASNEIFTQIENEIAELESSLLVLEQEEREAEEEAAAARKSSDARKRWGLCARMVKSMGGISLSKQDDDGALVVRMVTYLPPGGRREPWPSQTRMHSVSHTLKIWLDDSSGELLQATIHPEGVPIDDIVDVFRGRWNIGEFVDNVRHRIKVTERRLALLRQAMKGGLQVEYMTPIIKVALSTGDVLRLETSNDWPLPRSTLRLVSVFATKTRAMSQQAMQEKLIGLMDLVNSMPNVERSELVPLVSFIENRLLSLYQSPS